MDSFNFCSLAFIVGETMKFENVLYSIIRMGNISFHVSKTKVNGKIKYRTTRVVLKEKK